jgi:hypothetical protein
LYSIGYYFIDQIKEMKLMGNVDCIGETRSAYKILVGKSEGTRPRGRPTHIWEGHKNGS